MTKRFALAALLLVIAGGLYFTLRPESQDARESALPGAPSTSGREQGSKESASSNPGERRVLEAQADSDVVISGRGHPTVSVQEQQGATAAPDVALSSASPPAPVEEITGPHEELDNVQFMVRGYRDVLGENPVGNNAEVTRALMGENARQVKMPLPVGSHLNENGELVDRWGTPYFFHQLSGTEMEIRSAGADQQMWTRDDLLTR